MRSISTLSTTLITITLLATVAPGCVSEAGGEVEEDAYNEAYANVPLRIQLPKPVRFMAEYRDRVRETWEAPTPLWKSYDEYVAAREQMLTRANVISGLTEDADLVLRLRAQKKIFAYHVTGWYPPYYSNTANVFKGKLVSEIGTSTGPTLLDVNNAIRTLKGAIVAPFANTLNGRLADGFDAVALDELSNDAWDGSVTGYIQSRALAAARAAYPDRIIIVATQPGPAFSGSDVKAMNPEHRIYSKVLKSVADNANLLLLENYRKPGNPQLTYLTQMGTNLLTNPAAANANTRAALAKKTINMLFIEGYTGLGSDGHLGSVYTEIDPVTKKTITCPPTVQRCKDQAYAFLDKQLDILNRDPVLKTLPGLGFYVFDRADTGLVQHATGIFPRYGY